jgi:hypothetical protein
MNREAASLVEHGIKLKIAIQAMLNVQVHCHDEFTTHQIPNFVAVYDALHHG